MIHCSFDYQSTSYLYLGVFAFDKSTDDNGQGYVDAHRHAAGIKGHANAPDDIRDKTSNDFLQAYDHGLVDGKIDAKNGVQDPKC
jgi:hypothetical protein